MIVVSIALVGSSVLPSVRQPYSGRLIFDHFPKTAGQAINAWLREALGDGTVSPNLIGSHKELLRASGEYPVVSGHVLFEDGDRLDPRFQYATLLREPVDRTLSWLYFVTRNHRRSDLPELYVPCMEFLESEGEELHPVLRPHLLNPAVAHFASILGSRSRDDSELVETAFRAIGDYDCLGVYERLTEFMAQLATLIGIPAPVSLQAVNVTVERPAVDKVSAKLRDNIRKITNLDRSLYNRVVTLVDRRLAASRKMPPAQSKWATYVQPQPAKRTTPLLTIHRVRPLHVEPPVSGAVLQFEIEFELHGPIEMLEAGLHILDDRKRWAFGVNNLLLEQPFSNLSPGRYRIVHYVKAELPAGAYTIGFAFADVGGSAQRSLYWDDGLLPVDIRRPHSSPGVGSTACEARMMLIQWGEMFPAQGSEFAHEPSDSHLAA